MGQLLGLMFKSARPVMPLSHIGFRFELLFFCCYFFVTTFLRLLSCWRRLAITCP